MPSEVQLLQAIRLKGRPTGALLAAATGTGPDAVRSTLDELAAAGLCEEAAGRYRLTTAGRTRLTDLLAREQAGVNQPALDEAYRMFGSYNSEFKQIVLDWQIRDDVPNDHSCTHYDTAVIARLAELHQRFQPLLAVIITRASRLAHYPGRLRDALERIRAGEHEWLAKPLLDSYHTVWFELHEDLIGLTGRTRIAEAAAGRAE